MKKKIGKIIIRKNGNSYLDKPIWGSIYKIDDYYTIKHHTMGKSITFSVDVDTFEDFLSYIRIELDKLGFMIKFMSSSEWYMSDYYKIHITRYDDEDIGVDNLKNVKIKYEDWEIEFIIDKSWEDVRNEYIMREL